MIRKIFGITKKITLATLCFYTTAANAVIEITNGTTVPQGKYPFFVALGLKSQKIDAKFGGLCGGSLIASHWVLTARHCIGWSAEEMQVAVGSADLSDPSSYQIANVTKIIYFEDKPGIYHKNYGFNPPWIGNDIALLKLDRDITLASIQIAHTKPSLEIITTAIGQGAINAALDKPLVVKEVDIPIVPDSDCDSPELKKLELELVREREFCAGNKYGARKNILYGDSGGPLIQKVNGQYVLIGISARLITLDFKINSPAIFTNITYFYPWIIDTMKNN